MSFVPFSSHFSPSFWSSLTQHKLHVQLLSDDPVSISASYGRGRSVVDQTTTRQEVAMGSILEFDQDSFEIDSPHEDQRVRLPGILRNYNTIEDFNKADKLALLNDLGVQVLDLCRSNGTQGENVTIETLNPFLLLTFADLKKYRYYYWCGFPALLQKPAWDLRGEWALCDAEEALAIGRISDLAKRCSSLSRGSTGSTTAKPLSECREPLDDDQRIPTIVFNDPSTLSQSAGWPLRNVLTYLSTRHAVDLVRVVRVRENELLVGLLHRTLTAIDADTKLSVVGWEKNEKGKLSARMADLAPLLDPIKLADQAVDLNLQLMRWRIMPELNLQKIKETKVLLLGAGTLGCYVARTLMAWGVRKITLVDSSTVSFSNPVRQPLFEFVDSLEGGKPKAIAAAEALKRIYPGVDATGVQLSIPMPGHPIPSALLTQTEEDVKRLEELIEAHDVVYLLMDSRESRWLPTVIGAAKRQLVMNVALGFDTYLIMRHGVPVVSGSDGEEVKQVVVPGQPFKGRLGCYYCNDIVAPMDSLKDRTLDQMCTVTRPGIAGVASATAVELMVSVLQHPLGIYASSDIPIGSSASASSGASRLPALNEPASPLGIVPHQIRGFLSEFNSIKITGQSYDRCTGCSDTIINAYQSEGFAMLLEAFNDAKYLERLTGLDKLMEESERAMEAVDWDEEDEDDDE